MPSRPRSRSAACFLSCRSLYVLQHIILGSRGVHVPIEVRLRHHTIAVLIHLTEHPIHLSVSDRLGRARHLLKYSADFRSANDPISVLIARLEHAASFLNWCRACWPVPDPACPTSLDVIDIAALRCV